MTFLINFLFGFLLIEHSLLAYAAPTNENVTQTTSISQNVTGNTTNLNSRPEPFNYHVPGTLVDIDFRKFGRAVDSDDASLLIARALAAVNGFPLTMLDKPVEEGGWNINGPTLRINIVQGKYAEATLYWRDVRETVRGLNYVMPFDDQYYEVDIGVLVSIRRQSEHLKSVGDGTFGFLPDFGDGDTEQKEVQTS